MVGLAVSEHAGLIIGVESRSLAARLKLRPGDEVLQVNGHPVEDVIDVQFYAAEDEVEILYRRDGAQQAGRARRREAEALGIEFAHPTFDIDIRRCNNLCPFCFVLQTAPRMRRTLYIKDDDYRYSFLYGHFVTLTNLGDHDWQRIEEQRLSPLYVSVHATDPEVRRKCLANKTAPEIMPQLRWLAERRIQMHTQLVITPGLNDGPVVEHSVRDLAALYPSVQSVSVVPVGLTRHHKYGYRPLTSDEMTGIVEQVEAWQGEFQDSLGVRFAYLTDEWYLATGRPVPPKVAYDGLALEENGLGQVRNFLDDWELVRQELGAIGEKKENAGRRGLLVTGTLFAPTLRQAAGDFNQIAGTALEVVPVVNRRLGETITVAGLLMGEDVQAELAGRERPDFAVLPRVMFDHPQGISLDDISPLQIARALGCPVYLADVVGDVLDALTGANTLRFDPADEAVSLEVMHAGGWAVEKYL
jgi:putative radical SAM enzyme (TIGR03279 family)